MSEKNGSLTVPATSATAPLDSAIAGQVPATAMTSVSADMTAFTKDELIQKVKEFEQQQAQWEEEKKGMVPMILQYQPPIAAPPLNKSQLYGQACSNDAITAESWRDMWLDHIRINRDNNDIEGNSVMKLHGKYAYRPCICAGSGPSLKKNVDVLAKEKPPEIPIVSCCHNFPFFSDKGVDCKYWVNLDAGEITISEMSEGGAKKPEEYWAETEDKVLIAAAVSHPEFIKKWRGKIYWFNCLIPDPEFINKMESLIPKLKVAYNVGGNTFGAVFYHAVCIFGSAPIAFIGTDFAFDYTHKFHAWDSQYDAKFAGLVPCTDIFGNRVYSWQSYQNFRNWIEFQLLGGKGNNPMMVYNCTEGGTLGAYPNGNIIQIPNMRLAEFLYIFKRYQRMPELLNDPNVKYSFLI